MLSRELIIDACAIINLIAGASADSCLGAIEPTTQVTSSVEDECRRKARTLESFHALVAAGLLERCAVEIAAGDLAAFIAEHDLGAGESEAILCCAAVSHHLWSDDRKARRVAVEILGPGTVIGTLGILEELVRLEIFTAENAFAVYTAMRDEGGFLPPRTLQDFQRVEA